MAQIRVCVDAFYVNLEIPEHRIVTRTVQVGRNSRQQRERVTDIRIVESGWDLESFRASITEPQAGAS